MFEEITFFVNDNHIELMDKTFLLGELTTDILNITPHEFAELDADRKELRKEILRLEQAGTFHFDEAIDKIANRIRKKLLNRKLFQLLNKQPTWEENAQLDEDFHPQLNPEAVELYDELTGREWLYKTNKLCEIVDDIYAFNQTMFWFIDQFLMHLKKLDSENYAAALFGFYSSPGLDKMMVNYIRNGNRAFLPFDTVKVQYVPREVPDRPGTYAIYELYTVDCLQSFLKIDFMKAIMRGHIIRRCKNCKRFFLLTKGYRTDYCDRSLPDNPKRNCRNQGAKNTEKEKARNNPVIQSYYRAYQRITADKLRGRISPDDWRRAGLLLRDLRDEAISGRHSDREVNERMQSEPLYASLHITRRGGR